MSKHNTAMTVRYMDAIDKALPEISPETFAALSFSLVERGAHAGLTLEQIINHIEIAHMARAKARN